MDSEKSSKVLSFTERPPAAAAPGVMNLVVQGRPVSYAGKPDIRSLLESRGENSLYVNVRINDEVLGCRDYDNIPIRDGDRIDFLYFMGGGTLVQPDRRRN